MKPGLFMFRALYGPEARPRAMSELLGERWRRAFPGTKILFNPCVMRLTRRGFPSRKARFFEMPPPGPDASRFRTL